MLQVAKQATDEGTDGNEGGGCGGDNGAGGGEGGPGGVRGRGGSWLSSESCARMLGAPVRRRLFPAWNAVDGKVCLVTNE